MRDLIVVVPDKNTEHALKGAFERNQALGMREISYDFITHPGRDGGVRSGGVNLLNRKRQDHTHALLVFDHEGCGEEQTPPPQLEARLDGELSSTWGTQAKAIVVVPEMDIWMWGADHAIQQVLSWKTSSGIRAWLKSEGFVLSQTGKPERPKEAMERVLAELGKPRSSAIYEEIAGLISLANCSDQSFQRLRTTLINWFP